MSEFPVGDVPVEVSVVICVRNGAEVIERQLNALGAQEGAPHFEVIVVNNASSDNTRALVEAWIASDPAAPLRSLVVDAPDRPSIPYAKNTGAKQATGRILAFCDADDLVHPGWVRAYADAIKEDELAGGWITSYTAAGELNGEQRSLITTEYLPRVGGCNWAIARETFFTVGGFDESLPPYGFEEVDFSWRVQEAGFPIIYVDDAHVDYMMSDNKRVLRKRFLLGKGRILMASRYPRYDSRRYTLLGCLADVFRPIPRLVGPQLRIRRHVAGQIISNLGRVAGQFTYRTLGRTPKPSLLTPEDAKPDVSQ